MRRISANDMTLVDLFSGCGGFSLGAHEAGFKVAAAFDHDPILASSYPHNFRETRLILADIAKLDGEDVLAAAGGRVHGIFGGPPCQGFSDIGKRLPSDPRRQLLRHFFRIVKQSEPAFFVMENVRGLAYKDARPMLDGALSLVRDRYSILGPHIWNAAHFGAATNRSRLFVIGVHKDWGEAVTLDDIAPFERPPTTVRAAISDLDGAIPIGEANGFDLWRIARSGRPSGYASRMRTVDGNFTSHKTTEHTKEVMRRFARIQEGGMDEIGRHPRLAWSGQCPTLRAGTGVELGSYQSVRPIHPAYPRVITVREAARLQGFPDRHRFHQTVWHSFRMIGNSVSPIIARCIFEAVAAKFDSEQSFRVAAE